MFFDDAKLTHVPYKSFILVDHIDILCAAEIPVKMFSEVFAGNESQRNKTHVQHVSNVIVVIIITLLLGKSVLFPGMFFLVT